MRWFWYGSSARFALPATLLRHLRILPPALRMGSATAFCPYACWFGRRRCANVCLHHRTVFMRFWLVVYGCYDRWFGFCRTFCPIRGRSSLHCADGCWLYTPWTAAHTTTLHGGLHFTLFHTSSSCPAMNTRRCDLRHPTWREQQPLPLSGTPPRRLFLDVSLRILDGCSPMDGPSSHDDVAVGTFSYILQVALDVGHMAELRRVPRYDGLPCT